MHHVYIYIYIYIYNSKDWDLLYFSKDLLNDLFIQLCIYIYSLLQTDCFVLSELFSVVRHAGRSKPGSKPVQLYVRLSFRPLGHQADHVG